MNTLSLGLSLFIFYIFGFYGYSFYLGGKLRWEEVTRGNGELYSGGAIMSIMFSIMIGTMGFMGVANHIKDMNDARIAGKLAYDVMNHKDEVQIKEDATKILKKTFRGSIEFKNVNFKYPSRDDL